MRRLLIFITVLYVVWRVLIIIGKRIQKKAASANPFAGFSRNGSSRPTDEAGQGEQLVACSQCGTLLPASRALRGPHGVVFCSEKCRALARGSDGGANDAGR